MISTPQQFSVLIDELASSTWTLAALGLLFESGLADQLREPSTLDDLASRCPTLSRQRIERCLAVAALRGVVTSDGGAYRLAPGVLPSLDAPQRAALRGEYRSYLLQPAAYIGAAIGSGQPAGWRHTDPAILQAQGDSSGQFAFALKAHIAPALGDLAERLGRPGVTFLDVGAGVGALSIAMCQAFPSLRVVGVDPYDVPLALARANVAAAGLGERIELRRAPIQELRDEAAFDLAWLPPFFLGAREVVAEALARIRAALRPGGWLLIPAVNPAAGEAQRTVWSFVLDSWGGPVLLASDIEALLTAAGLAPRTLPGPSWTSLVVGQRPAR
jgi:SAM-dependent methyltransferase